MSRIRSIHPGIWTDEAFVSLSPLARLFYIGLWNECDDKGCFPWSPLKLKMRILPADNTNAAELLGELEAEGMVKKYPHGDREFGAVRNFSKHQRPKKPNDIHPASAEILRFAGMDAELAEAKATTVPDQFPTGGEIALQMEDGGCSSVSNDTGVPPSLSAIDMQKVIFDTGRTILIADGRTAREAGSIIGRWRKAYSDSQVLVALSRCQVEQPSDPVAWLTKTLQAEARRSTGQSNDNFNRPSGTATAAERARANLGCH